MDKQQETRPDATAYESGRWGAGPALRTWMRKRLSEQPVKTIFLAFLFGMVVSYTLVYVVVLRPQQEKIAGRNADLARTLSVLTGQLKVNWALSQHLQELDPVRFGTSLSDSVYSAGDGAEPTALREELRAVQTDSSWRNVLMHRYAYTGDWLPIDWDEALIDILETSEDHDGRVTQSKFEMTFSEDELFRFVIDTNAKTSIRNRGTQYVIFYIRNASGFMNDLLIYRKMSDGER